MKKSFSALLISIFTIFLGTNAFAAIQQQILITASVPISTSATLINCSIGSTTYNPGDTVNWGNITPQYDYIDTPNVSINDPWQIVAPIRVRLNVTNNNQSANLFIQTDHKTASYWNSAMDTALAKMPTANISGLLNTTQFTSMKSDNIYKAIVPMRAWADYSNEGTVTTNPNSNWVWVVDKSMGTPQKLLYDYQKIINGQLDIYIRSCWDKDKLGGSYQGNIKIIIDNE